MPATLGHAPNPRARSGRSRWYKVGVVVFVVTSVGGYFGLRTYIYGEDAPPIPVLDDLGG
jgi:hypothetical protein